MSRWEHLSRLRTRRYSHSLRVTISQIALRQSLYIVMRSQLSALWKLRTNAVISTSYTNAVVQKLQAECFDATMFTQTVLAPIRLQATVLLINDMNTFSSRERGVVTGYYSPTAASYIPPDPDRSSTFCCRCRTLSDINNHVNNANEGVKLIKLITTQRTLHERFCFRPCTYGWETY